MKHDYTEVIQYIHDYWNHSLMPAGRSQWSNGRNLFLHLGRVSLPYPAISPNHDYFAGTQYYWDTYFTVIGLVVDGHGLLAKNMVDNLCHLFRRFGLVPARNSWTSIGRTQPPFLTRMAFEVYDSGAADDDWLDKVMETATREYEAVWCGGQRLHRPSGLSRYQPRFMRRLLTTYESGWDVSSRFALGRTTLLPVDLNSLLYQYEVDLEKWCNLRGDKRKVSIWRRRRKQRKKLIDEYFWDKDKGFYFDFDTKTSQRDELVTIAGFFPLWSGAASKAQAETCRRQLKILELAYGIATTEKLPWRHRQWDYPNAWSNLQYVVITGLRNYGFNEDADRLTEKWLGLNEKVFKSSGRLWEKYDVRRGRKGRRGRYQTQAGFAWTNSVFLRLLHDMKINRKQSGRL